MPASKAAETSGAKQRLQGIPVRRGVGLDDGLESALGPGQELVDVEGRVLGPDRRHTAQHRAVGRQQGRAAGVEGRGPPRQLGIVLRLTPHAPAQHRIELVEDHGGHDGEDEQFEDLQDGPWTKVGDGPPNADCSI